MASQTLQFKDGYANVGWWKKQWPWWTAGLLTATAEIINYLFLPLGHPKHKFIGVTSGMARMLASFETTLFGGSLIATKPDYQPSIQWVIIGALVAAMVLAWREGEFRAWAKYPKGLLVSTALGAFLFAWGTRVAGGCTLHHLLGGFAAFNLKSIVVMLFATVGALIGFVLLRNLRLSPYFKSQETKWYVKQAHDRGWGDGLTYSEKPANSWLRIVLYAFMILLGLVILYNALAGNSYAVQMGWAESLEKTKMYGAMLISKNLANIAMLVLVGALLGASVAKTGFGTECGLINPELGREVEKGEEQAARRWRIPFSLRTIFASYQPFAALSLHIFLVGLVMLIGFAGFNIMEGHHWATEAFGSSYATANGLEFHHTGVSIREMTSWPMDIFGGILLGIGTILMIGCEFRNYGRTGLLYITGLLIWPFFYLGYLPYTLARDFWDNLMGSYPYAATTFVPALIAPGSKTLQALIYLVYLGFWGYMFVWAMRRGARNVGVKPTDLLRLNSEGMYIARLRKLEREGKLEELDRLEREIWDVAAKDEAMGTIHHTPSGAAAD